MIIKFLKNWGATIIAAICGLAAFFVVFADAVVFTETAAKVHPFTGLQMGLGFTLNDLQMIRPSAGIVLAYLFPLLAVCVMGFGEVIGSHKKIFYAVTSAMMLVAGILALCILQLVNGDYFGTPSIAGGAIASGVLSLTGATASCAAAFLKK